MIKSSKKFESLSARGRNICFVDRQNMDVLRAMERIH